ncbi:MAG TPA: TRAP transporter permease [Spirochaetota bacterium]|nr:TRAP transporter permease [Spirochaetota bacterium]
MKKPDELKEVQVDENDFKDKVQEIMAKYDKESFYRQLTGKTGLIIAAVAICFSLFHLYTAAFGMLPAQLQRAVHLSFVFFLVFMLYPAHRGRIHKISIGDVILAAAGVSTTGYIIWNYQGLIGRAGAYTQVDVVVGAAGILLILEACRRVVGLPILIIAVIFMGYAYFGAYMPGFLNHRGYSADRIITHLFFTTEGILGLPLGVCATFIFLFILFGAFMEETGIAKLFIDLSNALAGRAAGGPAKVAVLTSALEGTVSGSSVANTVGSGSFTIPMMKKLGYKPEFAAAVEAAASTGGQIMPPIMGAAAFLMAEALGIPYLDVAKAAIIPAILYFSGIWIVVHFEAKKIGLRGMSKDELPKMRDVMREKGHLLVPLIAIIYFLVEGSTPVKAAFYGIIFSVVASMLRKSTRLTVYKFILALQVGAKSVLGVAVACGVAGIIVGIVTLTGLGLKMASGLLLLSGGVKYLTLGFAMLASLVLGMGVPTTANYLITSTIMAPAVIQLGVPALAAHMFVFYFGIIADITPPVALAAYAGAAIAGSDPMKTGLVAVKLAIAAFIIPYIFVNTPAMLLIDASWSQIMTITVTSLIGMIGVGSSLENYYLTNMNVMERIAMMAGGLMLIDPGFYTDVAGLTLIVIVTFVQLARKRREKTVAAY